MGDPQTAVSLPSITLAITATNTVLITPQWETPRLLSLYHKKGDDVWSMTTVITTKPQQQPEIHVELEKYAQGPLV